MKITITESKLPARGIAVVFVSKGKKLGDSAIAFDKKLKGAVKRALRSGRFDGDFGDMVEVVAPAHSSLDRLIIAGMGKPKEVTSIKSEHLGGMIFARTQISGAGELTIMADAIKGLKIDPATFAAHLAAGVRRRAFRFDKYRTKEPANKKPSLKTVDVTTPEKATAQKLWRSMAKVFDGVDFTKMLVSEPANVIYPESFCDEVKALEKLGVTVEVLNEQQMQKLGMNALLAVGQGSERESFMAVMHWNGLPAGSDEPPVALVGKGVTFDTGGISIKPSANMDEMKWDMGGAGIVAGAMKALAGRKAKVNVVGLIGLVENMPSGSAQRPGDIVKSMSGQTIEVLNTDAEGRLVLADVLWYAQDRFKPKAMVDLATLTGAIIVTLGRDQFAGLFTPDDKMAKTLEDAGKATGDTVWRLPMTDDYDKMINTPAADVKNLGDPGAGSITAAQFLKRFTNNVPWAHIDVAGTVWSLKDTPVWEKGATGFGVRLLDRWVQDNYEAK